MNVVNLGGETTATARRSTGSAAGTMGLVSGILGRSASMGTIVSPVQISQVPAGMHISRGFTSTSGPAPTSTPTSGSTAGAPVFATPTPKPTSPTTTMTNTGSSSGMATSTSGSMGSTPAAPGGMGMMP